MSKKERLNVLLIGCGHVAKKHMKALVHNKKKLRLTAMADLTEKLAADLLKSSKLSTEDKKTVKIYTDYKEMLAKEKAHIAIITTPSSSHHAIAMDALAYSLHLLLEKPMAMTVSQAKEILDTASAKKLKVAMGHIYRYFPLVNVLAQEIAQGTFGKPLYGEVKVFWGHDQAYYDRTVWKGSWEHDGGAIMNQTIHAIDLMAYLQGGKATSAVAMLDRQVHNMEAEDLGMAVIKNDNGSYFTVTGTTSSDPYNQQAAFELLFSRGHIRAGIKSGRPYFSILKRRPDKKPGKQNLKYLFKYIVKTCKEDGPGWLAKIGNPHSGILNDLISAIENDSTPIAHAQSGYESVLTVIAIYQAAKKQKQIEIPAGLEKPDGIFSMDF